MCWVLALLDDLYMHAATLGGDLGNDPHDDAQRGEDDAHQGGGVVVETGAHHEATEGRTHGVGNIERGLVQRGGEGLGVARIMRRSCSDGMRTAPKKARKPNAMVAAQRLCAPK